MLSHDSHRNNHDSGGAKENGNKNTGKENDKSDKIADKKSGSNVGFDERNPNLCWKCRKVDFNALFGAHDYEINCSDRMGQGKVQDHCRDCRCRQELISRTNRLRSPRLKDRGLLGKLDSHAPACSFCTFLYQCQVRLNLIPAKQEQWYCIIEPYPSLEDVRSPAGSSRKRHLHGLRRHIRHIQDIVDLQMCKVENIGSGRTLPGTPIPHRILRVADSGSKTLIRNKDASGGILGRKLDPNKVDLNLIGEWLTLCRSTHSHCKDVDAGRIPGLLVIDCTTDYIVPIPHGQNAANQVANYVTLSYLWGTAEATGGSVVQSTNCDGGSGLALPTQIPLVISDAIRVVKQLGYRYLWVDRYCIPQEDGAAKHIQILNMGRIYSNSILTIIAAAGDGPDYGLPGVSSRPRITQAGVQINNEISLVLYEPPTDHIINSRWNTRGWTYQEGLLSKRRLVFTDLMVYFQCHEMHGDEVLSLPIPGSGEDCDEIRPLSPKTFDIGRVFPKVTDWDDPFTVWERISEYGPRELGYDSDALNAISGVMEMYALALGDLSFKLFCGLPIFPVQWKKYRGAFYHLTTRMFSFRTWFENAEPYKVMDDSNLTCSLVCSLCWSHEWGKSFESPASFERARRKVFGSWTTAGWRTRKSKPDRITFFDRCLRIRVQYSGELSLDWEDDNSRILDLSRNGKIPLSLNITGLVMDVQMIWEKHIAFETGTEGWVLKPPFTSKGSPFEGCPRWLFEEAALGKGDSSEFLFLILGCHDDSDSTDLRVMFLGIILRPVTRLSDWEARIFHEKLDSCSIQVSKGDWPRLARLTREMEVRLI